MTDFQRCQQAATAPACPEKVTGLLTPRHLELIHQIRQALHRATNPNATAGERVAALPAWQAAAERLAVALVSRLAVIEEADCE
ncbi:hypothetical protein [Geopseudomonas sagittaria]|uniref:hypothetical protein n=1 Tax=Geopseudomonas sagittaria TaxID=1135990 RepID=UPI0011142288|nr:hypothetical protein [Pseudomonas sagittaria]